LICEPIRVNLTIFLGCTISKIRKTASKMQPKYFRMRHRFQDVDLFAKAARAWNLNINQIERGRFKGDLLQRNI